MTSGAFPSYTGPASTTDHAMKRYARIALLAAAAALAAPAASSGPAAVPVQSAASFAAAVGNRSSSPSYVMIAVAADFAAEPQRICTLAPFLLGAIVREHDLPSDAAGLARAAEIALDSPNHMYRLRDPAARANVGPLYSETELAAARTLLAPLSTDELKRRFGSLSAAGRLPLNGYSRDAVACVLLERGLSPRSDDRSGQVFVRD